MTTRSQHYVWRRYLKPWQNQQGFVHCSRNWQDPFITNPVNIMQERDFYKLPRITEADAIFLRAYIEKTGSPVLRKSHRNLVAKLAYIANADDQIQSSDTISDDEKRRAEKFVIETMENLHGQTEHDALPILDDLRHKWVDFIEEDEKAITFFHFIAQQFCRTKSFREGVGEAAAEIFPGQNFDRLQNIVSYIGGVNIGGSLFVNRKQFEFIFMESQSEPGFVTGDQPVVNLMGNKDGGETNELAFYYPLSPGLSCLLAPKEYKLKSVLIPCSIVEELNDLIARNSRYFLVANSNESLRQTVGNLATRSTHPIQILDSLRKGNVRV